MSRSGSSAPRLLPPGVEVGGRRHASRNAGIVEREDRLVVDDQVSAPGPLLQSFGLGAKLGVGPEERVGGPPSALDQSRAEEDRPGLVGIYGAVRHPASSNNRHPVEADLLVRQHRTGAGRPVRFGVLPSEQVLAYLLDLLGGDRGDGPGPEPGGLGDLGRDHERRGECGLARAGTDREPGAAGAEVLPSSPGGSGVSPEITGATSAATGGRLVTHLGQTDMGQQTGQGRGVDLRRPRGSVVALQADLLADLLELGVQVLPLPHPEQMQELLPAAPPEGVAGQLPLALPQVVPEVERTRRSPKTCRLSPSTSSGQALSKALRQTQGSCSRPRTAGAVRQPAPGVRPDAPADRRWTDRRR